MIQGFLRSLTISTAMIIGFTSASSMPAQARTQCIYVATNGGTWAVATQGSAQTERRACRRAKRRCNRKLERAKRRGEVGRRSGVRCRKHSNRGVSFGF